MTEASLITVVLGMVIGAVLALTGAGGGILAVPLLVFALGLSITQAAPVGLLAVGLAAAVGSALGLRQGIVRYRAATLVSICGIFSAPFGLYLAHRLPNQPLTLIFSLVLLYTSINMIHKVIRNNRHREIHDVRSVVPCALDHRDGRLQWSQPCARALTAVGIVSGTLSGLLGVGGGFVIIPALKRFTDLPMESIAATSLAIIALVSIGSASTAAIAGIIRWDVGVPFSVGAIIGIMLGRYISTYLSGDKLQLLFALTGIVAALLLASKAAYL